MQVPLQILSIVVPAAWAFFFTLLIFQFIRLLCHLIPGLHMRLTEEEEKLGGDLINMGEVACKLTRLENLHFNKITYYCMYL